MAIDPCSMCRKKFSGKPDTNYWAWFDKPDHRISYRQALCIACAADWLAPLIANMSTEPDVCDLCGTHEVDGILTNTFLTAFLPGREQYDDRLKHCLPCGDKFRAQRVGDSRLQADREVGMRGPSSVAPDWSGVQLPV